MLTVPLTLNEFGVFAEDPDDGNILYSYAYATEPDFIPITGGPYSVEHIFNIIAIIGNAKNVVVSVASEGVEVLQQMLTSDGSAIITLNESMNGTKPIAVYLDGIRITNFIGAPSFITFNVAPSVGAQILIEQVLSVE